MIKKLLRFLILFLVALLGVYVLHTWVLDYFSFSSNSTIVNFSYVFNLIYTLVLITTILILSKKFKDQLGFIFMAGSMVKIGVFLAVSNLNDFEINKSVFLDFFIPYVVCLILEVYYVSKTLNSSK